MPTFLIESYQAADQADPTVTESRGLVFPAAIGPGHRLSFAVPDEETCFHVLDGPSQESVRDSIHRAGLRCDRITEAVVLFSQGSR